jgi:hypothetical protein
LEKKRGMEFTDTSKKLTCPKSLCERHSKQQNGNNKTGPLSGGKSKPIKSVVKTAGSDVKPLISPSSVYCVSSGPGEEDGWGRES